MWQQLLLWVKQGLLGCAQVFVRACMRAMANVCSYACGFHVDRMHVSGGGEGEGVHINACKCDARNAISFLAVAPMSKSL